MYADPQETILANISRFCLSSLIGQRRNLKIYKDKVLYFDLYQSNEVINHKKIRSLV